MRNSPAAKRRSLAATIVAALIILAVAVTVALIAYVGVQGEAHRGMSREGHSFSEPQPSDLHQGRFDTPAPMPEELP